MLTVSLYKNNPVAYLLKKNKQQDKNNILQRYMQVFYEKNWLLCKPVVYLYTQEGVARRTMVSYLTTGYKK